MFLLWFLRGQSAVHQGGRVSDIALCYRRRDRKDKTACWWVCSGEFKYVLDLKMLTVLYSLGSDFPHRQLRVWEWWCITDNTQVFSSVLRPSCSYFWHVFALLHLKFSNKRTHIHILKWHVSTPVFVSWTGMSCGHPSLRLDLCSQTQL